MVHNRLQEPIRRLRIRAIPTALEDITALLSGESDMDVLTPDTIVEYAMRHLEGAVSFENIQLSDDFNLRIKVDGEGWTGKELDYRIAKFILGIQHDVLGSINTVSGGKITLKNIGLHDKRIVVKVEVKDGCMEVVAKLGAVFAAAISNMSGPETVAAIAIVSVICAKGYTKIKDIEAQKEIAIKNMDEQTKLKAFDVVSKAFETAANNSSAIGYIVRKMQEGDTLKLGDGQALDRQEAKQLLPPKIETENSRTENVNVDDTYEMPKYDYENQIAFIRKGGISFEASTKTLDEQSKKQLQEFSNEADLKQTFPVIALNVVIVIKDGKVDEAFVVGIGEKREGTEDIHATLKRARSKPRGLNQASLLDHI